jgi:hypothetical protein
MNDELEDRENKCLSLILNTSKCRIPQNGIIQQPTSITGIQCDMTINYGEF